jgi:hypothetical protein
MVINVGRQFVNPSTSRQLNVSKSLNKGREAVVSSLPISMHTGQIFLLTKLLTKEALHFYDFSTGVPIHTWTKTS